VRHAGWDEHRAAGRDGHLTISEAKLQNALEHMPCLVVGIVYMERGWSAAAPLVD
jgi:hypothetical protein